MNIKEPFGGLTPQHSFESYTRLAASERVDVPTTFMLFSL